MESFKKGKFVTKFFFFSDNVEQSSKNVWKMISADVNANNNTKKRSGSCILPTIFHKKYLQNLEYNAKACIFHLILIGILSILIFFVKNRVEVEGERGVA